MPILPPFTPFTKHLGSKDAQPLPFSDIFELEIFSRTLQIPIIEWKDIKNPSSGQIEDLGCWAVFGGLGYELTKFQRLGMNIGSLPLFWKGVLISIWHNIFPLPKFQMARNFLMSLRLPISGYYPHWAGTLLAMLL